jgi:hypothetical protein
VGPGLPGALEAIFLHQPLAVVGVHKVPDRRPNLLEILTGVSDFYWLKNLLL